MTMINTRPDDILAISETTFLDEVERYRELHTLFVYQLQIKARVESFLQTHATVLQEAKNQPAAKIAKAILKTLCHNPLDTTELHRKIAGFIAPLEGKKSVWFQLDPLQRLEFYLTPGQQLARQLRWVHQHFDAGRAAQTQVAIQEDIDNGDESLLWTRVPKTLVQLKDKLCLEAQQLRAEKERKLKEQVQTLQQKNAELSQANTQLRQENERLTAEIERLNQEIQRKQATITQLEKDVIRLKENILKFQQSSNTKLLQHQQQVKDALHQQRTELEQQFNQKLQEQERRFNQQLADVAPPKQPGSALCGTPASQGYALNTFVPRHLARQSTDISSTTPTLDFQALAKDPTFQSLLQASIQMALNQQGKAPKDDELMEQAATTQFRM